MKTIFRFKQIHRSNKIRLHKILIRSILCYGSVTWTMTQITEHMLQEFERKKLRSLYGPVRNKERRRHKQNSKMYSLYEALITVDDIKILRIGQAGHIKRMEDESVQKNIFNGKFNNTRFVGKRRIRWEYMVQRDALHTRILGIRE